MNNCDDQSFLRTSFMINQTKHALNVQKGGGKPKKASTSSLRGSRICLYQTR